MELILYSTSDGENVINKTIHEEDRTEFSAKSDLNIVNPVLRLRFSGLVEVFNSNYAEIVEFNRFYFIRSIRNVSNEVWELILECDVLESFKHEFMLNTVNVSRNLKSGDFYNGNLETETIKEVEIYESSVQLNPERNIILSTIGVGG